MFSAGTEIFLKIILGFLVSKNKLNSLKSSLILIVFNFKLIFCDREDLSDIMLLNLFVSIPIDDKTEIRIIKQIIIKKNKLINILFILFFCFNPLFNKLINITI